MTRILIATFLVGATTALTAYDRPHFGPLAKPFLRTESIKGSSNEVMDSQIHKESFESPRGSIVLVQSLQGADPCSYCKTKLPAQSEGLGAAGALKETIETAQIKLTYSASSATLVPGRDVTLILDVQAKPNVHVYALGAEHYIPIDWQMTKSKAWTSFPASYPAPRILHIPAIMETTPVYDGHFRIVRDIAISQEAEITSALTADRTLVIEGSFRYQACDDKECYFPRTLPLKWIFAVV